jgi:LuxR family maltose regulon positive regulatory protein
VSVAVLSHLTDASNSVESSLRRARFAIPQPPRSYLERPRVIAAVERLVQPDATNAGVALVSAPIGCGKTTTVAALARKRTPGSVAWCTLAPDDNEPHEFGLTVLEAMLSAHAERRADIVRPPRAARDALDEAMLVAAYADPMLLVIDQCEEIQPQQLHGTVHRVLRQAPPNLALVLVTNHDMPLGPSLARRVSTVRASDLAFGTDDLRAVFGAEHLPITDDAITALRRWTEGVASTVMCAVAAYRDERDRDRIVDAARRGDTACHATLHARLLARLPREHVTLLTATAIVDPVSAALAQAISGIDEVPRILGELVRAEVFFDVIPGLPGWYRHRHPSRELLAAELHHRQPGAMRAYNRNAARWLVEHGRAGSGLEAAIAGRDWPLVFELVRTRWIGASVDELDAALGSVPALPEPEGLASADAALTAIALDIERDNAASARERLAAFDDVLDLTTREPRSELFEALLRMRLARDASDAPGIDKVGTTLREWCELHDAPATITADVLALAGRSEAEARLLYGDLEGAMQCLEDVCTDAVVSGRERQAAEATASLALVTALAGRVRRAGALVDELGDAWFPGAEYSRGARDLARALCAYHGDSLALAQSALSDARASLRPGVFADIVLPLVRARVLASIGDEAGAVRLQARVASRRHGDLPGVIADAIGLTHGDERNDTAPLTRHPYVCARDDAITAVQLHADERFDDAWDALEHALALIERNAYRRLFVDLGVDAKPLLHSYVAQARPFTQVAWQLLQRLPTDQAPDDPLVVDALTPRELAVLRQLPTMKSNREIAVEMFFSVNTVKTHLKSIYRKLGVNGRRAAVEEARARSLL